MRIYVKNISGKNSSRCDLKRQMVRLGFFEEVAPIRRSTTTKEEDEYRNEISS